MSFDVLKTASLAAASTVVVATALLVSRLGASDGAVAGTGDAIIAVESDTVVEGGNVTVDFTITPAGGVIVGAVDVDVHYDNAVLMALSCTPASCNPAFDADTVHFSLADLGGLDGVEGTITFQAVGAAGTMSPLDVVVVICVDETGADLTCVDGDGMISLVQVTPPPSPSPSPGPTATPEPGAFLWGDVDCNLVVNAVDALAIQRWKVLLPVAQEPGCLEIGVPALPTLWGDVDCGGVVNAVDSLAIQRWKVALPVAQMPPCPVIGSAYP